MNRSLFVLRTYIWIDLNQNVIVGPKGTDQSVRKGPVQL